MRRALLLSWLAVTACSTAAEQMEVHLEPPPSSAPPVDGVTLDPVNSGATINSISVYQGVEVRLMKDGKPLPSPNAPVITQRDALVRVHATYAEPIAATLRVKSAGKEIVITDGPKKLGAYVDGSLDSTFNFPIDAAKITTDTEISVEIPGKSAEPIALKAVNAPKLRVELVPIKYTADGSNRLPDLGEASLKAYHDAFYSLYPVSAVEITQHAPFEWPLDVSPLGNGWSNLLDAVRDMRRSDKVDEDVYYVGVFDPAPSLDAYCKDGCILGYSPSNPNGTFALDADMSLRAALVLGMRGERWAATIAQEVAHAMGRTHAPCGGPATIDSKYPYKNGAIGTSGYDVLTKQLVEATGVSDFMSYCHPAWVSDYTWKGINDRMLWVQGIIAAKNE